MVDETQKNEKPKNENDETKAEYSADNIRVLEGLEGVRMRPAMYIGTTSLAGLNHLFQHASKGTVQEYGEIEETIAPEVLELIGAWINERFATTSAAGG